MTAMSSYETSSAVAAASGSSEKRGRDEAAEEEGEQPKKKKNKKNKKRAAQPNGQTRHRSAQWKKENESETRRDYVDEDPWDEALG